MRKIVVFFIILNCTPDYNTHAQTFQRLDSKHEIICYADHVSKGTRILPIKRDRINAKTQAATFEVEYIGFTPEAEAAFQAAVDIWATLINSPVTIRIEANWESLGSGVLGSASWGTVFANFDEAQQLDTWYPIALAEKIAGRNFNGSAPDVIARFNSDANWYLGTDGNPAGNQFDFVSVVLHEIGHGLGFTDSFSFSNLSGSFGLQTIGGETFPMIYDIHVENVSGDTLTVNFTNPSVQLGNELTSNDIFFDSPVATADNGTRPSLYAPSTWNAGSSIAHLNEATYPSGNENSLMTPQIGMNEVMQDPGPVTLNMLADMGWEFVYIKPDRPNSEDPTATLYPVLATVTGDVGIDGTSLKLHYSTDNFITETVVDMVTTSNPDEYTANIMSTGIPTTYYYYISVNDSKGRGFRFPGLAREFAAIFETINNDTDPPVITHSKPGFLRDTDPELVLEAIVKDFLALSEVKVDYFINNSAMQTGTMTLINDADSVYQAIIDVSTAGLQDGDSVRYTITATDVSSNSNSTILPSSGLFVVDVVSLLPSASFYFNDFNASTSDFLSSGEFIITTPAGFGDGAIHSNHPYSDGTGPNDESNYTIELRVPILIAATEASISFDEIVLVEPGETGTVFGDFEFWDYVIVEGSKDGGSTWLPFLDGYDSRANSDWETLYNSSISNNNSNVSGTPDLFRTRGVDMLQNTNFNPGEEVLIRFRLFADQAAHGWGWAIDNLLIQIDNLPPVIRHNHVDLALNTNLQLQALFSDNRMVDSVAIEWRVNDLGQPAQILTITSAPEINSTVDLDISAFTPGDTIKYRYVAFDPDDNVSYLPSDTTFFEALYANIGLAVNSYANSFDSLTADFYGNYFGIETPTDFTSEAIHSTHPYPLSFGVDGTSDFTYTLLKPILIAATEASISFDELVLVEPGEAGTVFGDFEFQDYVIVEGSKDGGITWLPIIDGYDSRANSDWETLYNSSISNNNSNASGTPDLFRAKTVDILQNGNFNPGEEVLIRFRLFANQTAYGWGWAIDNLLIQIDNVPAVIHHNHVDLALDTNVQLQALISDNRMVDSVAIEWRVNDLDQPAQILTITSAPEINSTVDLDISAFTRGDTIKYRYVAFDPDDNVSYLPSDTTFFKALYANLGPAVNSYSNSFDSPTTDFYGNYFSVESLADFTSGAVHSTHPYPLSFGLDGTSDFTYTLLKPITIASENARMAFDEVVLAEPFITGFAFGTGGFNDFVIVEGSKDGGLTWIPFEDGYDSRATNRIEWLTAYNNESDGSESLSRNRIIDLVESGDFLVGNKVLIRLRLNSNEVDNGWGWSIDNLEIQTDAITAIEEPEDITKVAIFPNPLTDEKLNIVLSSDKVAERISIELADINGRKYLQWQFNDANNNVHFQADLSDLKKGIYLLKIVSGDASITRRIIKY